LKQVASGNLKTAWGGIAGVQFSMPAVWTAARQRGFSAYDVYRWMSRNISDFMGWSNRKGYLVAGSDADIVIWDPESSFDVTEEIILHRHKITPYQGCRLWGRVKHAFVNGMPVDTGDMGIPHGEVLTFHGR
jgi:allantoinase